jgi:hypothetical protein
MARIASINPDAAAELTALRTELATEVLAAELAKTALQRIAMDHKLAVEAARKGHKRLPRVALS